MRQFLFLLILFFSSSLLEAQTYVPFPTDSAKWKVTYHSAASQCLYTVAEFQYIMNGDTVIGTTTYKKLYDSGVYYGSCTPMSFGSINLIYEDSAKHIFMRYFNTNTDTLLYDFNLNVGDTVKGLLVGNCNPTIVTSIDSILIHSSYRKRFNYSNQSYPCIAMGSIIEGIGGTQGLLEPIFDGESWFVLDCFTLRGQTIYPDTISNCPMVVPGISTTNKKECFPKLIEQSNQKAHYKFDCGYSGTITITAYDLIGRELFRDEVNSDELFVPLQENLSMILHFEWNNKSYSCIIIN